MLLLVILDGFGYRPTEKYNAIAQAKKPNWDYLWNHYSHCFIDGSGHAVGLPDQQMGNSEVGHLNIGAGRVVYQEFTRIDKAIETGEFAENPAFNQEFDRVKKSNSAIHIMGLLSPGGVHSHEDQILAMIKLAQKNNIPKIYFHAFLDGRDTPPKSASASLQKIEKQAGIAIASIMGRYYAMDRDKRLDRTEAAFNLLTQNKAEFHAENSEVALEAAYLRGETDEFVKPTLITPVKINPEDCIIFMNFRSDRARQLTKIFLDHGYEHFVSLTMYADTLKTKVAFPPQTLKNTLPEYLSSLGLKQLHIAETEKYAHVTFFFNGGVEDPYSGEDRILVPSPKVATYDLQPEMSAPEVTNKLVEAILSKKYDFLVCNFANPDMVGHTGNFDATVKAIECIDQCLGKIYDAIKKTNGEMLITADHGNAECMYDDNTQQPHTAHTSDPVPFLYISRADRSGKMIRDDGVLSDIAPTILYLMGIAKPKEMTGKVLIQCDTNGNS
ncbi:MAG: 2,3-bisphosphoglycerate-independent phosphoglycerate mutase [Gammaproteobacteria bacterium]|nr:2,3-bisphosphoglycerate-independent phosphoglycerate mutase [Gammaproteobacteria bacterium]